MSGPIDVVGGLFRGLAPEDLLVALAGLCAFLVVLAVWQALLARPPLRGRARSIAERREGLRDELLAARPSRHRGIAGTVGLMHRVTERLNLMRSERARRTAERRGPLLASGPNSSARRAASSSNAAASPSRCSSGSSASISRSPARSSTNSRSWV